MSTLKTGDTFIAHSFSVELGSYKVESLQEVSGLTLEVDSIEVKQVTAKGELIIRKLPGARKGGEVTITRGLDKSEDFTKWLKESMMKGNVGTARQNVSIVVNDTEGKAGRRYNLKNAWVNKWEGPGLKAGESGAATEKVTLVYEDAEIT